MKNVPLNIPSPAVDRSEQKVILNGIIKTMADTFIQTLDSQLLLTKQGKVDLKVIYSFCSTAELITLIE